MCCGVSSAGAYATRGVRPGGGYAWLLGLREPILVRVVDAVVDVMGDAYPELEQRREHLRQTTRSEEERFLATIAGGMSRFDELAPESGAVGSRTISGDDVFRLYDTFGFPVDLVQLMAEERGYEVDVAGFELALEAQRARSRADRAEAGLVVEGAEGLEGWEMLSDADQVFVGYQSTRVETEVLALRREDRTVGLILRENPFYAESGGQIADGGEVMGYGWTLHVQEVRKIEGRTAVFGMLEGELPAAGAEPLVAEATVPGDVRHDTERNHTATHLLHAALRAVLGEHVVQRGSLVAPDRLRFDFAHTAPMSAAEREEVEGIVNRRIWEDRPVEIGERSYRDAVEAGAMALFGEKYGDEVRVVQIPGVSMELCGGTHVRHTGEIGLFHITSESGVAAGVRRIEALTGPGAFGYLKEREHRLDDAARVLKTQPDNLSNRAEQLLGERAELESLLDELRSSGGAGERDVASETFELEGGAHVTYRGARLRCRDADDARKWGDAFLSAGNAGVALVGAELPGAKHSLFAFVTDGVISRGVRADALVREVAAMVGGRGGGRPHMAQAGVEDAERLDEALRAGAEVVRRMLGQTDS